MTDYNKPVKNLNRVLFLIAVLLEGIAKIIRIIASGANDFNISVEIYAIKNAIWSYLEFIKIEKANEKAKL